MFNTVLSTVTGQLDKRFLLNAFFPVGLALLGLAAVIITSVTSVQSAASWWTNQSTIIQVSMAVASVALVFVLANALANNMLWITRLFEGYALPDKLGACGRRYYRAKFCKADIESKRHDYPLNPTPPAEPANPPPPEDDQVLPTRLGNVLRNGESYPAARYGVDAVRVWPRLYHLVPETMISSMSDARASMESALAVSFLAGLVGPLSALVLLVSGGSVVWPLLVLWGALAISGIAYQSALPAAAAYRDHIRAAFDLHRLELLSQMQMPMPVTADEERVIWASVTQLLISGYPHGQRYVRSS